LKIVAVQDPFALSMDKNTHDIHYVTVVAKIKIKRTVILDSDYNCALRKYD